MPTKQRSNDFIAQEPAKLTATIEVFVPRRDAQVHLPAPCPITSSLAGENISKLSTGRILQSVQVFKHETAAHLAASE